MTACSAHGPARYDFQGRSEQQVLQFTGFFSARLVCYLRLCTFQAMRPVVFDDILMLKVIQDWLLVYYVVI
jgi:hypothetical protein